MKSLYSVVKAPLISEKSTREAVLRKYTFWVDVNANKIEIKRAVEKVYNVKVDRVNSILIKGKMKRVRSNQAGKTVDWKKATVTLKEGFEIKLT